jgi:hypothetical protein
VYDDEGVQVVVPELRESFDKLECAELARRRARRRRESGDELIERARRLRGARVPPDGDTTPSEQGAGAQKINHR